MSTPTERPILFSGPMVRAILDGTKTQTRRLVKQLRWVDTTVGGIPHYWRVYLRTGEAPWPAVDDPLAHLFMKELLGECPYGQPGDRLWVRETFRFSESTSFQNKDSAHYRADLDEPEATGQWKPAIHMPRWASRLTLVVEAVRVERLQDITDSDVIAEGIAGPATTPKLNRMAFALLWGHVNGKRATWDSNPWVWVVTFSRVGAS